MIFDWERLAICSLVPNAQFSRNSDGIDWDVAENNGVSCPTDAEIQAEMARLQADHDAKQYQRDRAAEYPPVTDYLDGIVKGDTAQVQAYIDACLAVKTKYPKPE
jgi:hypothetical protein